ncbi:formate dehydrogenase accessory protein FdhE [Methylobacterium sp. JK268]
MARFFRRGPRTDAAPEASPSPREAASAPRDLKPDPDRIGIAGSVPFARLPAPGSLFGDRAKRLRAVAPGHPLEGYLLFLAELAAAQDRVQARRREAGVGASLPPSSLERAAHGMPPLGRDLVEHDPALLTLLAALLAAIDVAGAPEPVRAARERLLAAPPEETRDLALQVFEGAIPLERLAECTFAAAALQLFLAECTTGLDARALNPVADGVCPCCGGAPVASLIVGWTPADKARYLACGLCGTQWNHVRIRCTACGSGEGISYYGLDEVSKDVQVETCTACHSSLKHLHQDRAPGLDPIADDVATYGLDLKVAEEGFHRAGLNPLFVA